jgi:hypothetical protein
MNVLIRPIVLASLASVGLTRAADCPPGAIPPSQWRKLEAHDFVIDDATRLQALSLALLPCLDDPNPKIRDGLAIDALTTWLRDKQIRSATAQQMMARLLARLSAPDDAGFGRPFAALALAEVARMDRIESYLTVTQYAALVDAATRYLPSVRDYRGFDEREGWRHGVAHGADWLTQLAMNPRTTKPQLDAMLDAIASQIAPSTAHFYIYGESGRLAHPVLFIAQRHLHSAEEWRAWLAKVNSAAPFTDWRAAGATQQGLSMRHNKVAFLNALYVQAQQSDDAEMRERLLAPLAKVLEG